MLGLFFGQSKEESLENSIQLEIRKWNTKLVHFICNKLNLFSFLDLITQHQSDWIERITKHSLTFKGERRFRRIFKWYNRTYVCIDMYILQLHFHSEWCSTWLGKPNSNRDWIYYYKIFIINNDMHNAYSLKTRIFQKTCWKLRRFFSSASSSSSSSP